MSIFNTGVCLLICGSLALGSVANSREEDAALAHATRILHDAPIVDGHNDLPWVIRERFGGDVEGYDISVRAQYDTDLPRLREGIVGEDPKNRLGDESRITIGHDQRVAPVLNELRCYTRERKDAGDT